MAEIRASAADELDFKRILLGTGSGCLCEGGLSSPAVTAAGFNLQVMNDLTSHVWKNVTGSMKPVALRGS